MGASMKLTLVKAIPHKPTSQSEFSSVYTEGQLRRGKVVPALESGLLQHDAHVKEKMLREVEQIKQIFGVVGSQK